MANPTGAFGATPSGSRGPATKRYSGAFGTLNKGGSSRGSTKSAGSSGGKKGLVTSPFQKPIAGRKISGSR